MFPTEMHPNEIVGYENMQVFVQHLRICKSPTNAGEFPTGRLNKEIGPANRDRIAAILNELRNHGFYPLSVDGQGRVVWGVLLKNVSQRMMESGLAEHQAKSIDEQIGRAHV